MTVHLPPPTGSPAWASPLPDVGGDLAAALLAAGLKADTSARRRAEYSSDASNYRVVPQVVVFPRDPDEVIAALDLAREYEVPVTSRGGGTSVAGNAVGSGVVLDFSRHLNRVLELDPQTRTARVQPGCVLRTLQEAGAPHGLRFGPDPSTWTRCTIGGMIGNNACGPRSLVYGRTADNVLTLDVVDGMGRRFTAGTDLAAVPGLEQLVQSHLALLRTELGRFPRQLSGYSLEHLLPERGTHLAKALVGTEGTCVTVLEATVSLVPVSHHTRVVALGYPSMPAAADDVPLLATHQVLAIEGLDAGLVAAVVHLRGPGAAGVRELPEGSAWLLVEVEASDAEQARRHTKALIRECTAIEARVLTPQAAAAVWRLREDGAGLAGRTSRGRQAWPGLEDAAVPPEHLGAYLRDFERLTARHDVQGMTFGHFGEGCLHVRLDLPLETEPASLRALMTDAAALIASYGGSLSGEHGDGRARSELLPMMYSPEAIRLFESFKGLLDPCEVLNPGVVVRPRPLSADLRRPAARPTPALGLAFAKDGADLSRAVHRCVGVGRCRADNSGTNGFMCPSYQATRDEKDSTRGRARVLQEMVNGTLVDGSLRSREVAEALDLCLSCKACSTDCPAGVDMAALKTEVLYQRYRGRPRPVSHYTLGWLPRWARLATRFPGLANGILQDGRFAGPILRAGGVDRRRAAPRFAARSFRRQWADSGTLQAPQPKSGQQVVLWVDTFSDTMTPHVAMAAVRLFQDAGYEVLTPRGVPCCGLPWISTGQLGAARRRLRSLVRRLEPYALQGLPIVGLEPSCTAVLRSDLLELLPDDEGAARVSRATLTIAELLTAPPPIGPVRWTPPDLSGHDVVVQPHCHHRSVMGYEPDLELLRAVGTRLTTVGTCCGLAGNFGMEQGHYEVSVAVAENGLLPALRRASPAATLLADGFSCRTQAEQLAGRRGVHLAELLSPDGPVDR